jgi:hypothetical protein
MAKTRVKSESPARRAKVAAKPGGRSRKVAPVQPRAERDRIQGQANRDEARGRRRRQSAAAADVAPIPSPAVEDPSRRAACGASLKLFFETYFPAAFTLAWSADHEKVIAKVERAIHSGGMFCLAMPRGSGKSTIFRLAAVWAILYGHCRYVVLVAATADRGDELLDAIKTVLRFNDLLWQDFKTELHAIRALEGEPRRCRGQTFDGQPTQIEWGAGKIVFPTIPGSMASGAIITGCGLTGGEIRGQFHTGSDGQTVIRPDLVLVDDPQTKQTARSKTQTKERVDLINGDVLGMAGPDRRISGLACVTVIEHDDLAEKLLDREASPAWQGERMQMLYAWPTAEEYWDQYLEILRGELMNDGDGSEATAFYAANQEAMDAGSIVAWPERKEGRLTGLQLAMDLCFRDRGTFMAEYQNDPETSDDDLEKISSDDVVNKANGLDRRRVADGREKITAHVDIHDKLLYYTVCAWSQGFAGEIIDYGTWPKQRSRHFAMRNARTTLQSTAPSGLPDLDAAILHGLRMLTGELLSRTYQRMDGAAMFIDSLGIDIGYKDYLVRQLIQVSPHAARIQPMKGEGIGPDKKPISEYRRGKGVVIGNHWWTPPVKGTNQLRHVHTDTNHWKSFVHRRLAVPLGGRGCLSLWGMAKDREQHRYWAEMIADSEYFERTEGRGRVVDVWTLHVNKPDNHAFDNLVGCAVLASKLGITDADAVPRPVRQKVRLSDVQRQKRQQRMGAR